MGEALSNAILYGNQEDPEKLVRVLRILGRRNQALLEARKLVEVDPNQARRQRLLAEICAEAAKYADAVTHRARAVVLDGGDGDDYVELAIQLSDGCQTMPTTKVGIRDTGTI